jgi:hypothetical protein
VIAGSGGGRAELITAKMPRDRQIGVAPAMASGFDSFQKRIAHFTRRRLLIKNLLKVRMTRRL